MENTQHNFRVGLLDVQRKYSAIGTSVEHFSELFSLAGRNYSYHVYDVCGGEIPHSTGACDAFLITGSPAGIYEDRPWIEPLVRFTQACHAEQKKLAGICFGHQLIAQALGGKAERSPKGWGLGLRDFSIVRKAAWINPPAEALRLTFAHRDQVTELPPGAELFAANHFCPNIGFTMNNHIISIQAHPEFSKERMPVLLQLVSDRATESECSNAAETMANDALGRREVATWIANFFEI